MKGYKIFTKLFFTHTTIALVSVVSLSILFYVLFREALIQRTLDQLSSINILKKNHIDEYFSKIKNTLEFQFGQKKKTDQNLIFANEKLEQLKLIYDFQSIVVVDSNYRNLTSTSDSLLISIIPCFQQQSVTKFQTIEVSSCITSTSTVIVYALPLLLSDTETSGIIFIQENFDKIQTILLETTGMGNTGESYLIGPDFKMRSRSRFDPNLELNSIRVDSSAIDVMSDSSDDRVILDYRGVKVLSVHRAISDPNLQWTLISEIDFDEAMRPLTKWRNYIIVTTIIIALLIIGITYLTSNSISRPILQLKNIITGLSKGNIQKDKVPITDTSEIGLIAQSIHDLTDGLKRTTEFANEIGAGRFDTAYTTLSDQDSLGHALISMRDKLKRLTEEQVKLVREKASALLEGQENERKRIVQELHDGVGQLLTGIRLRVQGLNLDEKIRHEILTLINETITEVKRISYNVMPNSIVDFGLEAALRGLCENVRKSTLLTIDYRYVTESSHSLRFEVSIAVFRIIQEGFNNIMKHAKATQVELHVLASEQELYFLLKDDGQGFDVNNTEPSAGLGLHSMKERARLLGGNLEIHSSSEGTIVEAWISII